MFLHGMLQLLPSQCLTPHYCDEFIRWISRNYFVITMIIYIDLLIHIHVAITTVVISHINKCLFHIYYPFQKLLFNTMLVIVLVCCFRYLLSFSLFTNIIEYFSCYCFADTVVVNKKHWVYSLLYPLH